MAALARAVVLGCLLVALAGCGDDDEDPEPTTSAPASSTATVRTKLPPPREAVFDRTLFVPENARPGDELGGPDWMAEGFESLWVKRDNNAVERISPDGQREATIDAGIFQEPVCQGIGVTDTAVWACASTNKLIRIDPDTNDYTIVNVSKLNEQGRLTFGDGLLWVLNSNGDGLQGLSDDGQVDREIDLGAYCTDTADTAPDDVLWVACANDGVAMRVDLASGEVTDQVEDLPHANAISVAGAVWVGCDDGLVQIDAETLAPVSTTQMDVASLRTDEDAVVVRELQDALVSVVDGESGNIHPRLSSPRITSGGDVIQVAGRWWITSNEDNLLLRLRPF